MSVPVFVRRALAAVAAVAMMFPVRAADAADWPQFRGSAGAGVAEGAKPPVVIGPDVPATWKVRLPGGASSPCISGDRIFLTAYDGGKLVLIALSKADGKELWRAAVPAAALEDFHKTEGSPAASTPVTDGKTVVAYFGSAGLFAWTVEGKAAWEHPLPVAKTDSGFGSGTSPVIADGKVLLARDTAAGSSVAAYDLATGREVWKKAREGFPTSWSTPAVWNNNGSLELVVPGTLRMKAYDVRTGEERWTVAGTPSVNCTTPVVGEGMLLFAGWSPGQEDFPLPVFDDLLKQGDADKDGALTKEETEKTMLAGFFESNDRDKDGKITRAEWEGLLAFLKTGRNCALAIKSGAAGDATATHVAWRHMKGLPYVASPILHEGKLWFVRDGGILSALDAATGKPVIDQQRLLAAGRYYASPVAADGHLYFATTDGAVTVLKTGAKPAVVHKADFGERISATPAIVDGVIYIRTFGSLYAFGPAK